MTFRLQPSPKPRRLSGTAVEQAVRETEARDVVEAIQATETLTDGRKQVRVSLRDAYDDPRTESPAAASLIASLEAGGWTVAHARARAGSRLTVSEPPATEPEEG